MVKLAKRSVGNLSPAYDSIARRAATRPLIRNAFPIGVGKGRKRQNPGAVPKPHDPARPLKVDFVADMRNA